MSSSNEHLLPACGECGGPLRQLHCGDCATCDQCYPGRDNACITCPDLGRDREDAPVTPTEAEQWMRTGRLPRPEAMSCQAHDRDPSHVEDDLKTCGGGLHPQTCHCCLQGSESAEAERARIVAIIDSWIETHRGDPVYGEVAIDALQGVRRAITEGEFKAPTS